MANYYISMAAYMLVAQWAASTSYAVGAYVRQLATVATANNAGVFRCTVAGTSGGTEPTWVTNSASTTTDGGASWVAVTGAEAEQLAGNWRAPAPSIAALTNRWSTISSTADTIFVSDDHVTSATAALSVTNTAPYFSVKRGVGSSMPPVAADLNPGAVFETVGTFDVTVSALYAQGLTFRAGRTSTSTASIAFNNSGTQLKNCRLELASTGTSSAINIGNSIFTVGVFWDNCTCKFGNASQRIIPNWGELWWKNSPNALDATGSIPTTLAGKASVNGAQGAIRMTGLGLSALNTTIFTASTMFKGLIEHSILHASVTLGTAGSANEGERPQVRAHECSYSGAPDVFVSENNSVHSIDSRTNIYATDGASDGLNNWSLRVRTTSGAPGTQLAFPYEMTPIAKRVNDTGLPKTFTIEAAILCSALPQKRYLFADFHMLITSGSKLASVVTSKDTDLDTTTVQTSTVSWNGPARANSTSYSLNDVISVSSRPGELFICTSGGTSAGSLPSGYATATIAAAVTDGSCSFRLLQKIKFEVTATPRTRGIVRAYLRLGLPAVVSQAYAVIDPKIRVS